MLYVFSHLLPSYYSVGSVRMANNKQTRKGGRNDTDCYEMKRCYVFSTLLVPSNKDSELDLTRYIVSRSVLDGETFE
jgi:hypothetical protein